MDLRHYPRNDGGFVLDRDRVYRQDLGNKPYGFWVSAADSYGWDQWCQHNDYCADSIERPHAVELVPDVGDDLLVLDTASELVDFTSEYARDWDWMPERPIMSDTEFRPIQWPEVAKRWGGVLITPYQWSERHRLHWYYGWDCASGCIWDLSLIQSVTAMELSPDSL